MYKGETTKVCSTNSEECNIDLWAEYWQAFLMISIILMLIIFATCGKKCFLKPEIENYYNMNQIS